MTTPPPLEIVTLVIGGVTHTRAVPIKKPKNEFDAIAMQRVLEGDDDRDQGRWWNPFSR